MIFNAHASKVGGYTAEQVGESGARNIIPYPYYETTHTDNGITWTDNGDGTVTANGTATVASGFYITPTTGRVFKEGTYKVSGSENPSNSTYRIQFFNSDWSKYANEAETGIVTLDKDTAMQLRIHIASGVTVNNLTFRPMLELGSVAHEFVPYHFGGAENTKTLNGYNSTDFYRLGAVESLPDGANLDEYVTLGQWGCDTDAVAKSILNKPEEVTTKFRLVVEATTRNYSANYIKQTIERTNGKGVLVRYREAGTWYSWHNPADKSAAFVKTTGGTVTGATFFDYGAWGVNGRNKNITKGTNPTQTQYVALNFLENGGTGHENRLGALQTSLDKNGIMQTLISAFKNEQGGTASQNLGVVCMPDGTGYAYAPHPSNPTDNSNKIPTTKWVNDFALARTGGTVADANNTPLGVKNTAEDVTLIKYIGKTGDLGSLGFARKDLPVYRATDNTTQYALHHDGNSAKVVISQTAPSDTSALWVY